MHEISPPQSQLPIIIVLPVSNAADSYSTPTHPADLTSDASYLAGRVAANVACCTLPRSRPSRVHTRVLQKYNVR